jgi:hypothetical protein
MKTTTFKKSFTKFAFAAALSLSLTPSVAQGPGWTALSTVAEIVVTASGGINVRLTPELQGCVSQSGYGHIFASVLPSQPD